MVLGFAVVFAIDARVRWNAAVDQRVDELNTRSLIAMAIVDSYRDRVTSGALDLDDARLQAVAEIERIRYRGGEYIFGYDYDGVNVIQPVMPRLKGQDLLGLTDPNGVELIRELRDVARTGGGAVSFQ